MEGFPFEKIVRRDMWRDGGYWPPHLFTLIVFFVFVASDRFELETDSAVDHTWPWLRRSLLPEPAHVGPRIHICPREPQPTAELLHHHVFRQVPSVRYVGDDIRHGFS